MVFGLNVVAFSIWRGHDAGDHQAQANGGDEKPVSDTTDQHSLRSDDDIECEVVPTSDSGRPVAKICSSHFCVEYGGTD